MQGQGDGTPLGLSVLPIGWSTGVVQGVVQAGGALQADTPADTDTFVAAADPVTAADRATDTASNARADADPAAPATIAAGATAAAPAADALAASDASAADDTPADTDTLAAAADPVTAADRATDTAHTASDARADADTAAPATIAAGATAAAPAADALATSDASAADDTPADTDTLAAAADPITAADRATDTAHTASDARADADPAAPPTIAAGATAAANTGNSPSPQLNFLVRWLIERWPGVQFLGVWQKGIRNDVADRISRKDLAAVLDDVSHTLLSARRLCACSITTPPTHMAESRHCASKCAPYTMTLVIAMSVMRSILSEETWSRTDWGLRPWHRIVSAQNGTPLCIWASAERSKTSDCPVHATKCYFACATSVVMIVCTCLRIHERP